MFYSQKLLWWFLLFALNYTYVDVDSKSCPLVWSLRDRAFSSNTLYYSLINSLTLTFCDLPFLFSTWTFKDTTAQARLLITSFAPRYNLIASRILSSSDSFSSMCAVSTCVPEQLKNVPIILFTLVSSWYLQFNKSSFFPKSGLFLFNNQPTKLHCELHSLFFILLPRFYSITTFLWLLLKNNGNHHITGEIWILQKPKLNYALWLM